ncbi:MAG: hypothetical protein RIB60_00460 [Phycisphaerales bacterium]
MTKRSIALAALAGLATAASADLLDVEITVGPPSAIDLELCQDLPIVGGCDSDQSDITGSATFQVDTTAGTVCLISFSIATTESLDYTYTGVLSQVDATAPSVTLVYAGVGPTAPAPLAGDGSFTLPAVPLDIVGTATVTGSIFGLADVNEVIDFAEFGPFIEDLAGSLTESGGVWTLSSSFTFNQSTVGDVNGITVTTTATGALTLEGTGSATPVCAADCDGNGALNLDDIDCFVAAFLASDLAGADCDGNGALNLDDIDCFVSAFLAGCP